MLSARARCLLAICGGCGFDHGVVPSTGDADPGVTDVGVIDDAQIVHDASVSVDAPIVPPDAATCFGTFVEVCLTTLPTTDTSIDTATTIDTDTGCTQVVAQTSGPDLCVVAARTFHINAALQANGSRPLVLVATDSVDILAAGLVDVGSFKLISTTSVSEVVGAGAASGAALCGNPTNGGADGSLFGTAGGGGGAGGSFGGAGGKGGRGVSGYGGTGGVAAAASGTPSYLRGGCRGSAGGSGNGQVAGAGAAGGGAVLVIAGSAIHNAGHIRACGMGGYAGSVESGGGGGGSGGMIVVDAPAIQNTGIINANGGGGGEGGGGEDPGDGGSSALTGMGPAPGGQNNTNGGDGGAGSWATAPGGVDGATGTTAGGAGGGGAGVVRVYPSQTLGGKVSPPAS